MRITRYSGQPVYMGAAAIGRPIFDLSGVALLSSRSGAYKLVGAIQARAKAAGLNVHALPAKQMHVTVVNPIFTMEPQTIPSPDEQAELFSRFVSVLRGSAPAILTGDIELKADEIYVRQKDIKLVLSGDTGTGQLKRVQAELADRLRRADPRFDFAEGHPSFHVSILRFSPAFGQRDHEGLQAMLRQIEEEKPGSTVSVRISSANFRAVQFNGLFHPWSKESRVSGYGA